MLRTLQRASAQSTVEQYEKKLNDMTREENADAVVADIVKCERHYSTL
jgi:hypothetical protein